MSNQRDVISNDNRTAYERWELPLVDEARGRPNPRTAPVPEPVAEVVLEAPSADEMLAVNFPTADELENIRQAAYEEGLSQGYGEGLKKGEAVIVQKQKLLEQQSRQLLTILRALQEPLAKVDEQLEAELVSLVLAITRQVVYSHVQTEAKEILAVVRAGLSALPASARKVRLFLHPQDLQHLREHMLHLGEDFHGELTADETIKPGGCRLSSDSSAINLELDERIAVIFARLQQAEAASDSP